MLKPLIGMLVIFAGMYVAACVALFVFQRSFIYYPQPRARGDTSATMQLAVTDAQLQISVRPSAGSDAIVYFGGNGENVAFNLPAFSQAFPGHALYLMNYRGYGGSSGSSSEAALQQDALALFDSVRAEHANVVVMGRSLGSGIAVWLASQRPASRLVLITPYASIAKRGAKQFPIFPVRWLLRDKFESWRYAPAITVPTLLIVAEQDSVIPRSSTDELYASFRSGVARLETIPGVGHNDIAQSARYLPLLRSGL